ncbi:MAG: ABC transporter ATP-binding protein [Desulfobacterales bacterium]|jgi:oligopeptide transport system ATP-binding protein|nr:ABC transporter ATP-binding protein [Desulfobacterales bacterium]
MLLNVRHLSTHFHSRQGVFKAVDDISFNLDQGQTLGIVGESGCGKTVTALSLLRLIPDPPGRISAGEIFFNGRNLLDLKEKEMCDIRGNQMAMIFQEPMTALHPVLSVGRQVMEPLILHKNVSRKAAINECIRLLRTVRIPDAETRLNDYPHQFSGGMRQRVMVAMGLACDPRLIIADEPTTALDVTIQAELLEFMKGLTHTQRSALILITHNLGIVARYADQVMIMYAGRIIEKSPTPDLYRAPRHPYTMSLLASVPRLDKDIRQKLVPIEGQPPDMANLPTGCAFHPRCRHAMAICRKETPSLREVSANHEVACWMNA